MSHIQDSAISQPPMLCLLDSGVTGCWISRKKLPPTLLTVVGYAPDRTVEVTAFSYDLS